MLVDDEIMLLDLYKDLFEANGYDVVATATDGGEAVFLYLKLVTNDKKPDIVIMDYRMPFKNGVDATQEILSLDPQAKIIVASADATVGEEVRSKGALEFVH